jgi:hypothetical protein
VGGEDSTLCDATGVDRSGRLLDRESYQTLDEDGDEGLDMGGIELSASTPLPDHQGPRQ